jgi:predicted nucleic acid-binding Zn ribbon protein
VAVCLACGYAQRYFEEWEAELPSSCPQCAGKMRWRCPSCAARFTSAFSVECEACGAEVRPRELFGTEFRKPGR